MNTIILISLFIAHIEGKQAFHKSLSTDDVIHYFGTNSENEIPDYEFISPQQINSPGNTNKKKITDDTQEYILQAFKDNYHLKLQKNQHLISAACLIREVEGNGTEKIVPCPQEELDCFYHGHSANHNGSWAAISTCTGLHGLVSVSGHDLVVQPVKEHHKHLISTDGQTDTQPHLVYRKQNSNSNRHCTGSVPSAHTEDLPDLPTKKSRRRRAARRYIEVKVVVAPDSYLFHLDNTRVFATTVMNIAAQRFLDPSLGSRLYLSLVDLTILKAEQNDLRITKDANTLLNEFCRWQAKFQTDDDSDPMHADNVILITGTDLVYQGKSSTSGLAIGSGMCKRTQKCSVIEDQGLVTGITIAHETGHTLGMQHDGENGNTCNSNQFIMAASGGGSKWSPCSATALQRFLSSSASSCLFDVPAGSATDLTNLRNKPGVVYSANAQCRLAMKFSSSHVCEGTPRNNGNECRELICSKQNSMICSALGYPRMDGTECGNRKWCIDGNCVTMGTGAPRPQNGGWSAFSSEWSACTRTCGVGVKLKQRKCNNPEPRFGGQQCQGEEFMSKLCNMHECPTSQYEYKAQQCAATDRIPFQGQRYHWIPLDALGDDACQYKCRMSTGNIVMKRGDHFNDGTECFTNAEFARCVNGKCKPYGCDGHLGSGLNFDHCGICNGQGNTCTARSGTYTQGQANRYVRFVTIPAGATGITITNDNGYCHMSVKVNNRLLFGQSGKSSDSSTYRSNGVVVNYRKSGPEKISIIGPIPVSIEALVWRNYGNEYSGVNPNIHYTYFVPNGQGNRNQYTWKSTVGACSRSCGTGVRMTTVTCMAPGQRPTDDFHCNIFRKPAESKTPCNTQDCPPEWYSEDWGSCSVTCGLGVHRRTVECVVIQGDQRRAVPDNRCNVNRKPVSTRQCNAGQCHGVWKAGQWSDCDRACSKGIWTRTVSCYSNQASTQKIADSECGGNKPPTSGICLVKPCNTSISGDACKDDADCPGYGSDVCHGQYESWARSNCALYCGYCVKDPSQYSDCRDDDECAGRDTSVCAAYKVWSQQHCKKLCNYCSGSHVSNSVSSSVCSDKVDCTNYQKDVCTAYKDWAKQNCQKHCRFCGGTSSGFHVDQNSGTCRDIVNCGGYQSNVCKDYKEWAMLKCPKYCGFCGGQTTSSHITHSATSGTCTDTSACNGYGKDVCTGYKDWAQINCQKLCGFCILPTTSSHTEHVTISRTCSDTAKCSGYKKNVCTEYKNWARINCQKLCGFCIGPTSSQLSTSGTCKDTTKCAGYKTNVCTEYKDWAKINCQKLCGFCAGPTSSSHMEHATTTEPCKDTASCAGYKANVCTEYRDWAKINCQKLCNFCTAGNTQTGSTDCKDAVDCKSYGGDICTNYREWADTHCKKHCGFCTAVHKVQTTHAPQTESSDCKDTVDCNAYGSDVCTSYKEWAGTHCKKHCGKCAACVDKNDNCASYGKSACQDYPEWARESCQSYCNLCNASVQTQTCSDKKSDCSGYGKDVCTTYSDWAKDNCKNYCNLCGTRRKRSAIPGPLPRYAVPPKLRKQNIPEPKPLMTELSLQLREQNIPEPIPIMRELPHGARDDPISLPKENIENVAIKVTPTPVEHNPNEDLTLLQGLPPDEGGQEPQDVIVPEQMGEIDDEYKVPPPVMKIPVNEGDMSAEPDRTRSETYDLTTEQEQLIKQLDALKDLHAKD